MSIPDELFPIDEGLGDIVLMGDEVPYAARLKARTDELRYQPGHDLYPLEGEGVQVDVSALVYVLVPDYTLTVAVDPTIQRGAIGTVVNAAWDSMRHWEIAWLQGRYYDGDRTIAMWEVVPVAGVLDVFGVVRVWSMFEAWLTARHPHATRILTDDSEPGDDVEENHETLAGLGYSHLVGRIWAKPIGSTS